MTTHTLTTLLELAATDEGREKIRVMVAEMENWDTGESKPGFGFQHFGPGLGYGEEEEPLPNYLRDLNACAEFEAGLRGNDLERYQHHLERVVFRFTTDDDWSEELGVSARTKAWHARALHRCMALILTKQKGVDRE